jgi:hypothetical protein
MRNDTYDSGGDWLDGPEWDEGSYAEVLGEVLSDEYEDADPEDLDDALTEMLESLSPAEAFGLTKAMGQIGRGADRIVSDPAFGKVVAGALPVAGGALGTAVGGPVVGTAVGTKLGMAAAKALPPAGRSAGGSGAPAPRASGGSSAALQGLVLSQHPACLQALLALAMGEHGRKSFDGVPVAAILSLLSTVFGRAAADADELMYVEATADGEDVTAGSWLGDDESLYTALMQADAVEIGEAVGWL